MKLLEIKLEALLCIDVNLGLIPVRRIIPNGPDLFDVLYQLGNNRK